MSRNYQKRGNPYLRGKTWTFVYYVTSADGTKKQHYKGGYKSKEEAEAALSFLDEAAPPLPNIKKYMADWFEDYAKQVSTNTHTIYRFVFEKHVLPRLPDHTTIAMLDPLIINDIVWSISKSGPKSYAKKAKELFSVCCMEAWESGILKNNPAAYVSVPRYSQRKHKILEQDQLCELLHAAQSSNIYLEILLALILGLRKGEIYGLKYMDFNKENHTVHIQRESIMEYSTGKDSKTVTQPVIKELLSHKCRVIMVPDIIFQQLLIRETDITLRKQKFKSLYIDDGYICSQKDGSLRAGSYLNTALNKMLKNVKGWHLSFEDLRFNFIKLYLDNGVDYVTIGKLLGYSSSAEINRYLVDIRSSSKSLSNTMSEIKRRNNYEL